MIQEEKQSGFVAGTLVHTDKGLVPIEQIKVGDAVLSKHSSGEGDSIYTPVAGTVEFGNTPIYRLTAIQEETEQRLEAEGRFDIKEEDEEFFFVSANHPFWVVGKGWMNADFLVDEDMLILSSGNKATVIGKGDSNSIQPLYFPDNYDSTIAAWAHLGGYTEHGPLVDLKTGHALGFVANLEVTNYLIAEYDPDVKKIWEKGKGPYTTTVYNIEVEDFHTYYVGKAAIWVHDASTNIS